MALPLNRQVRDVKPLNKQVQDTKPNNVSINPNSFPTPQSYTVTVSAGQTMGLLLALTYPVAGTFTSWRGG